MRVAFVKETRAGELRPLLLPSDINKHFSDLPVEILVESGIGAGVGLRDIDYLNSSSKVQIVDRDTAWRKSDVVMKLKRPSIEEVQRLREGAIITAFFHAEDAPDLVELLLERKIKAYSYEYFRTPEGEYPLMTATGEIAGKLAVIYAAYHLQSHIRGAGVFLAACRSSTPARAAVLGYGNVGRAAVGILKCLGVETHVFRWRYREENNYLGDDPEVIFHPWDPIVAAEIIPTCDVVIGAIRISTFDTPPFVTREIIRKMKPGSVIIDVTAGYGIGFIETLEKVTTLQDPFFVIDGVKVIRIRELPLGVHRTASEQISAQFAPYLARLVKSLATDTIFEVAEQGKITDNGEIVNEHIRRHGMVQIDRLAP